MTWLIDDACSLKLTIDVCASIKTVNYNTRIEVLKCWESVWKPPHHGSHLYRSIVNSDKLYSDVTVAVLLENRNETHLASNI